MNRLTEWILGVMLHRRTHVLEVFLGAEALACGLWILTPGGDAFGGSALLKWIPDGLLGLILALHGSAALYAKWQNDVHMCRRSALASSGIWSFLFVLLLADPPATRMTLPLVAGLAGASLWVYFRLYLLWHPPERRV